MNSDAQSGSKSSSRPKLNIYEKGTCAGVEYEVVQVPLQGYVSAARRQLQVVWRAGRHSWQGLQSSVAESVKNTRTRAQAHLRSVGVTNPALVAKVGGVGGAALVGYVVARKRSVFRRALYASLGAALVASTLYISEHLTETQEKLHDMQRGYRENVRQWTGRKS